MSSSSTLNVGSTPKHQKIQSKDFICSTDRISNLPESLITKILSLLSTKEAVATSVLSKNWIFAWTSITNLDFSDSCLSFSYCTRISAKERKKRTNYINYINRIFLLLSSPTIDKFFLFFACIIDAVSVRNWIVAAVRRNVRDVYLNLKAIDQKCMELPSCLYYCNTLEVLNLKLGIVFSIPENASIVFPKLRFLRLENVKCCEIPKKGSICFPVLKILHLVRVTYMENTDTITRLLGNSPILEELLIKSPGCDDYASEIDICAPALRTAEIEFDDHGICFWSKVQMDAPALEYLNIKWWIPLQEIIIKNQYSLTKVHVGLDYYDESMTEQQQNITKLLKAVSGVKYLTVDTGFEMAWTIPLFSNLIKLEMEMNCCDISVLEGFLENSINLHHLVYRKKGCHDYDNQLRSTEPCHYAETCLTESGDVPKCLISTLKMIEIYWVIGCDGDIALIKYILKNAILLDKMIIRTDIIHDRDEECKLLQKISLFPRGSASCEVEFL